ncbi:MAG: riboflavin synthase [Deltaproteobacteria bacterium]|nr:riboflavin synthase [Deltaproteobacteria bacterium]
MFTGLIEGIGKVKAADRAGRDMNLSISPYFDMTDCHVGDSISVNGVCLTATAIQAGFFSVFVSAESLSRSTLGSIRHGDEVNLERALRLTDRLGGHIVSGHVDGIGKIIHMSQVQRSWLIRVEIDRTLSKYTIEKGSIALDGISLTINRCEDIFFEVNIIPETAAKTTLLKKKTGDLLNIETDIIAKYIEKLIMKDKASSGIDMKMLEAFGFGEGIK